MDQQPTTPHLPTEQPEITDRKNTGQRPKWVLAAIGALLLVVVIAVVAVVTHHGDKGTMPPSASNPNHLNGVAVGNYAYVNACNVYSPSQQAALFAPASGSALIQEQYAENGVAVKDIADDGIDSNCSRDFEAGTPYDGTTLTFAIHQFATPAAAKASYAGYSQSQSDLDKGNDQFGTNLTTDFTPLGNVANTVYSPSQYISYTLDGNKILSFTAILGAVSDAAYTQALANAIPVMVSATAAQKPAYPAITDSSFGKAVGSSTIKNPCSFFTAADFAKAYGAASNPSAVTVSYTHQVDQYPPADTSRGWANNSCNRTRYPGSTTAVSDITAELRYYKTSSEAAADLKQYVQRQTTGTDPDDQAQTVSKLGDYAVIVGSSDDSNPNDFYVQKGPYVLVLSGDVSGSAGLVNPTSAQYQKLAAVLAAKL